MKVYVLKSGAIMYDVAMTTQNGIHSSGIVPRILDKTMQQQGISAAELARRTGISKATLSLILSGKRTATNSSNMAKLADELGVSVDYLMGKSAAPQPSAQVLGELLVELTQVARHLAPSQQRDLVALARTYLEQNEEARQAGRARLMEDVLSLVYKYGGEVSEDRLIDLLESSAGGGLAGDVMNGTDTNGPDTLGDDEEPT